ncbi:MAG: GNAT family N-acetyltransferase [Pyrinomonadaceae bacterium]
MSEVAIVGFQDQFAEAFGRLNYEWIERSYGVEEHDHEVLDHPVKSVIESGGQIFFAVKEGVAIGTVAMIPLGDGAFELAKMAVAPEARGHGVGDKLMAACVEFAQSSGLKSIILESNTKQEAAIRLYRKFGFKEITLDPNSHFVRANIRMELAISQPNQ